MKECCKIFRHTFSDRKLIWKKDRPEIIFMVLLFIMKIKLLETDMCKKITENEKCGNILKM